LNNKTKMAPNPLFTKLKIILEEMEMGERIDIETELHNDNFVGCYVDRMSNNTWQTHNGEGEIDLETFIKNLLYSFILFIFIIK